MDDIVFNPEERGELNYGPRRVVTTGGALTRLFMRLFGLTDEGAASRWLLGLAFSFFLLSILVWWLF